MALSSVNLASTFRNWLIGCAWAGQVAWQHWGAGGFSNRGHFFCTTLKKEAFVVAGPLPLAGGLRRSGTRAHARVVAAREPLPPLIRLFAGDAIRPDDGRRGIETVIVAPHPPTLCIGYQVLQVRRGDPKGKNSKKYNTVQARRQFAGLQKILWKRIEDKTKIHEGSVSSVSSVSLDTFSPNKKR